MVAILVHILLTSMTVYYLIPAKDWKQICVLTVKPVLLNVLIANFLDYAL